MLRAASLLCSTADGQVEPLSCYQPELEIDTPMRDVKSVRKRERMPIPDSLGAAFPRSPLASDFLSPSLGLFFDSRIQRNTERWREGEMN
jgi:hypothetical protein